MGSNTTQVTAPKLTTTTTRPKLTAHATDPKKLVRDTTAAPKEG